MNRKNVFKEFLTVMQSTFVQIVNARFLALFILSFVLSSTNTNAQEETSQDSLFPKAAELAGVKISGLLRNDTYLIYMPDNPIRETLFANSLETRLILDRNRDDWGFYADGRMYVYAGEFATAYGTNIRLALMRAFMRYYSPIGDFTLGKTYINFGNSGLFNPFEIDKSIQFTDLQYARQGIYALEYVLPWQDLSGLKVYVGIKDDFNYLNTIWGLSPALHVGKFDVGAVFNHFGENKNIAGIYFKGDAIVGIQGSLGAYTDDARLYSHAEASAGIDYSFFDGKLIASFLFYFNESGADNADNYMPSPDSFLLAKYYGFFSLVWVVDEFWNISANVFMNFVDRSALILPSVSMTIVNGLTLTAQIIYATSASDKEFSRSTLGDVSVLIRVEGRF